MPVERDQWGGAARSARGGVELRVLGPVEAVVGGRLVDLGPPKQRVLLALLVSRAGRPVAVDVLLEGSWAGDPPPVAMTSLRSYVANLRRVLEPDRPPRAPATVLLTRALGYLVDSCGADVDAHWFSEHARVGRAAWGEGDPRRALCEFEAGLGLWRGQAYAEVADAGWVAPEVARLEELRLSVIEGRCAALLALGAHEDNPVMVDADNDGHDVEPQPLSVLSSANTVRSKSFTRAFFCACLVALIWTIVLLGFIAAKTSVASTVAATLVSVITCVTLIIGVFQSPKFPTIDPKVTRGVVVAILALDCVVSVGWAGWSSYQQNRTIDVLSTVTLAQNSPVLPDGHATLDLPVTAQRDALVLVFRIVDHSADIGNCLPNTSLLVTPDTAGNRGETVFANSEVPTVVDLPAGITKLHLDISVINTRGDRNCAVDLSVVSAKLENK